MITSGERIIRANGVDLCVETFGDAGHPAILLIHGAGSSMLSWDEEFCALLAAGRRFVIRYDSRDAGRSITYEPGAPDYTMRDVVADAVGLLDALDVTAAHILGMSGGGSVAQLLALDHPDRVASLTLASSSPGDGGAHPDLPSMSGELRAFFSNGKAEPDWSDRDAVIDYLVEVERPFAARSRPFDEDAARELAGRIFDRSVNIASSVINPFMVETGDPWRHRLADVAAPTLIIHGTEDPLLPYGHALALATELPKAKVLALPQTGHEYFPRHTWDVVAPAILRHTSDR